MNTAKNLAVVSAISLSSIFSATLASTESKADKYRESYERPEKIPFPKDNQYSEARYELGRMLFFDPRLSGSDWISCATCHNPGFAWEDGLKKGIGHGMKEVGRSTPTVLNLAWGELLFWDGRADSLEEQSLGPIEAAGEMNLAHEEMLKKLHIVAGYKPYFEAAYPGEGITKKTVSKGNRHFRAHGCVGNGTL